ncbi:hypothetical protein [Actinomadura sp. 9N407]|uniref:hypothetical protein n=1 Tax=Actinomadura sp. 9N407 TaxID=3375154 RepID=UPI00379D2B31
MTIVQRIAIIGAIVAVPLGIAGISQALSEPAGEPKVPQQVQVGDSGPPASTDPSPWTGLPPRSPAPSHSPSKSPSTQPSLVPAPPPVYDDDLDDNGADDNGDDTDDG